ncbi:GNAT family N-acetyltransferase [Roseovarius dicentrarchi]|uniref:GNAT family N-acetyltransferase n=1 Tax=Roseovarius dicentrarchi TaxID=2250573 RepID=UPI000DE847D1|nr:GNAT family N-acetyltransferase [Roseovarius dicentrarchi]
MSPAAEDLARLHSRAFDGQGRGWSVAEFADLLASPFTCVSAAPNGFALSRVIAGEAELLTLATDPAHRRQGIAAALLAQVEAGVALRGAERQFLEVAADNGAAHALYLRAGYVQTGRRAGYYARADGPPVDALLMEKMLRA